MTTIIAGITKEIKYDRQTRDYACYVSIDGAPAELIGFAASHGAGEKLCNDYAYDYLTDNNTTETAAELIAEPFTASRDAAHREQRWVNILTHIATLPEPDKSEAITFAIQTIEDIVGQRRMAA